MDNALDFITRRSDFGQNYRGIWVQTNEYKVKDVVWIDLDKNKSCHGSETYFICLKDHLAVNQSQLFDEELWVKE